MAAIDRVELIELINTYGRIIDTRNWRLLGAVFIATAHADYSSMIRNLKSEPPSSARLDGLDAIRAWLERALPADQDTMHFMTNHIVETLEGDRATTSHYMHARRGATGLYRIEAVRTSAGWRISSLLLEGSP